MGHVMNFPTKRHRTNMNVEDLKKDLVKYGIFPDESAIPEGFAEFFVTSLQICFDTGWLLGRPT